VVVEACGTEGVEEGDIVGDSSPPLLLELSLLESLNRRKKSSLGGVPIRSNPS